MKNNNLVIRFVAIVTALIYGFFTWSRGLDIGYINIFDTASKYDIGIGGYAFIGIFIWAIVTALRPTNKNAQWLGIIVILHVVSLMFH